MTEKAWKLQKIWKYREGLLNAGEDEVVRELELRIILNKQEAAVLSCSPGELEFLTAGFLFTEGLIRSKEEIKNLAIKPEQGLALVETAEEFNYKEEANNPSWKSPQAISVHSKLLAEKKPSIAPDAICRLIDELQESSLIFQKTGGVHCAGLASEEGIIVFAEDIGRYNALDRVAGRCLLEDLPTAERILLFSGRLPAKVVQKAGRLGIPLIVSRSAPTDRGINAANELGITLIGFARGCRLNIYSHPERISPS